MDAMNPDREFHCRRKPDMKFKIDPNVTAPVRCPYCFEFMSPTGEPIDENEITVLLPVVIPRPEHAAMP